MRTMSAAETKARADRAEADKKAVAILNEVAHEVRKYCPDVKDEKFTCQWGYFRFGKDGQSLLGVECKPTLTGSGIVSWNPRQPTGQFRFSVGSYGRKKIFFSKKGDLDIDGIAAYIVFRVKDAKVQFEKEMEAQKAHEAAKDKLTKLVRGFGKKTQYELPVRVEGANLTVTFVTPDTDKVRAILVEAKELGLW